MKDLTDFLVKVYDNSKMKEKLGIRDQATGATGGTTHAFSMGQSMDTHVVDSSGEIGKLKAETGELKYRMHAAISESKTRIQKYKPEITPPRRRGGNFRRGGSFENRGQSRQTAGDNRRNQNYGTFRCRGQNFNNRAIRDMGQTQTETLNQMEDLGAGADLITARMYGILELLVKP